MAAIGFVKEVGQQTWEATLITREMAKEEIAAGHRAMLVPMNPGNRSFSRLFSTDLHVNQG